MPVEDAYKTIDYYICHVIGSGMISINRPMVHSQQYCDPLRKSLES